MLKDISADDLITLHSRRARRQDLSRPGRGRKAGRRRDARSAHAEGDWRRSSSWRTARPTRRSPASSAISDRTVKTHLGHLFEKLGVTSRTEAIGVATRRGLVRLE